MWIFESRGLGLHDRLVDEQLVNSGCLVRKHAGRVDSVFVTFRRVKRRIGSILVDTDEVDGRAVALVEEDLATVSGDDNVPGVNRTWGAHEHGEDTVSGEDGRFVLSGELVDYRVIGRGNVVGDAVNLVQFAFGVLDGRFIVCAVVVVQEAI